MKGCQRLLIFAITNAVIIGCYIFAHIYIYDNLSDASNDAFTTYKLTQQQTVSNIFNYYYGNYVYVINRVVNMMKQQQTKYLEYDRFLAATNFSNYDGSFNNTIIVRYTPIVYDEEKSSFEQFASEQTGIKYEIFSRTSPLIKSPYYCPILYSDPKNINLSVIGLDSNQTPTFHDDFLSEYVNFNNFYVSKTMKLSSNLEPNQFGFVFGKISHMCSGNVTYDSNYELTINNKKCLFGYISITIDAKIFMDNVLKFVGNDYINNYAYFDNLGNPLYIPSTGILSSVTKYEDLKTVNFKDILNFEIDIFFGNTSSKLILLSSYKPTDQTLLINILLPIVFSICIVIANFINISLFKTMAANRHHIEDVNYILSYINHEIRNPLSSIFGFIELSLAKLLDYKRNYINGISTGDHVKLLKSTKENLNTANRSTKMIEHIITDILDLKKIEDVQLYLENRTFNLGSIADNIYNSIQYKIDEYKAYINFKIDIFDKDFELTTDSTRIEQILINFILNSYKFTRSGDITLSIKKKDNDIIFAVTDTGTGIDDNIKENIFKVKFIGNHRSRYGVGIGLYLCKHIADLLNCQIGFTTEKDVGSQFYIIYTLK